MYCNLPGSCVHRILEARILEWVSIPILRGSFQPRDQNHVSCIVGSFFTIWTIREWVYESEIQTGWIFIYIKCWYLIDYQIISTDSLPRGAPFSCGWWKCLPGSLISLTNMPSVHVCWNFPLSSMEIFRNISREVRGVRYNPLMSISTWRCLMHAFTVLILLTVLRQLSQSSPTNIFYSV